MARRNPNDHPFEDKRNRSSARKPKKRRWPLLLLMLLLVLFFLPNLLGWTGLHQRAVGWALSDFQGTVTVEKASLGWFQPIKLTNISAIDTEGNDLFKVSQFTSSKSLISFINGNDYGQFKVTAPTLYLHLRPDGSNLEDALAQYLAPEPNPPATADELAEPFLPKATLNVVEGRALITSATDTTSWQIDGFQSVLQTATQSAPVSIDAQCTVTPLEIDANGTAVPQAPGSLAINGFIDAGETQLQMASIDLSIATQDLPVSLAAPILERFVGPAQSTGQLSGNLQSRIAINQQVIQMSLANVNLTGLNFVAPNLLGSDQFSLQNLVANGSLEISPQIISSDNFRITSDFGTVNANGRFDVNQLNAMATGGTIGDSPFQMDGEIDLAGLVRMLPATLQLHQDLVVESGTVRFQAGTKTEEGTPRLVMNLDATNLKARRGAQNIVWQKPLRLVGTIAQSNQGLMIEDLLCESDFLAVAGSANLQTGAFRAQGDLSKLIERLEQFADLQGAQLAGTLDGTFGWQTAEPSTGSATASTTGAQPLSNQNAQPIQIGGSFTIQDPVLQFPDMPVWKQPQLILKISASGLSRKDPESNASTLQLDQGGVQIEVGSEQAIATLAAPLANAFTDPWNLNCQITGGLNGWVRHVQNFVDLGDVQASGDLNATCSARLQNNQLQLTNIQYAIEQLGFDGYGMKIRDPQVTGSGTAVYDLNSGSLAIAETTLSSSSLAARGQNLTLWFAENMRLEGGIAFRADVSRLADWFELSPSDESVFWFGGAEGTLQLTSTEQGIGGTLSSTITDLVAAQRAPGSGAPSPTAGSIAAVSNQTQWSELFREPKTELTGELLLANDFNAVQFNNLLMKSSALNVNASGTIMDLAQTMVTNIQGTWNPEWTKINALMGAYTGNVVQLVGSGQQPFTLKGPVFSAASLGSSAASPTTAWIPQSLSATTSIRWDRGSVLEVPVGASQLDLDVNNSIGTVTTTGIPFSGGMIKFAPVVDMRGENPVLVMDPMRVIDNLTLSPDTARQWLKYVAPLVADATSAQGNIAVDMDSVKMPLMDPMAIAAKGKIHLKDVVIGAGPLADQLLGSITQLRSILKPNSGDRDYKTWLQMAEQTIPVAVENGRVYHENVTLKHNDTVLRTSGSVGFDQTLDLVAQIPIADDWIAGKSYLAGLKGQSISIPIGGTVTKPVFDKRAVQQLSSQLVKQAAGSAINDAIGKQVTPQIEKVQNQLNGKLTDELNKFQGKLGEKLGGSLLPNFGNGAATGTQTQPTTTPTNGSQQPDLGKKLEDELKKGFGNLFGN